MSIFEVEREILIFAMRYALGRMTFAPSIVIKNIKNNIDKFTEKDIKILIKDIENVSYFELGMDHDIKAWVDFKRYLVEKLVD